MTSFEQSFQRLIPWRIGIGVILCIILLRLSRLSSSFEFLAFDLFLDVLKETKEEAESKRITLISLDQRFIKQLTAESHHSDAQGEPPKTSISALLEALLTYQPTAIGLDIVSDRIPSNDEEKLAGLINITPNIIPVEKLLNPKVPPLTGLSLETHKEKLTANDFPPERDGTVRRVFLVASSKQVNSRPSLSFKLAEIYLENQHQIESNNGISDKQSVRFNLKPDDPDIPDDKRPTLINIPRLQPTSGAYRYSRETNVYGLQTLLNFRRSQAAFPTVSAQAVLAGNFDAGLLRDRILIIGITDPSLAAYYSTPFDTKISQFSDIRSQAIGIELQAHATSQLLTAVLDGRPLLRSLATPWEYLLIISAGLLGMGLGQLSTSTTRNLLGLGLVLVVLLLLGLSSMYLGGWWLPIVPSFLVCGINGVAYIAYYQNERTWKQLIEKRSQALAERDSMLDERNQALAERDQALENLKLERRATIEAATNEIHNGPFQTLALLIRHSQSAQFNVIQFQTELRQLDQEIRDLSQRLTQAAMKDSPSLGLSNGDRLDATLALHSLLNSVFDVAINRDLPGLQDLKVVLKNFEPCPQELSPALKRDIGHFLEEALCNVGKHAIQVTRLKAIGEVAGQQYHLTIQDNGATAANHPLMLHNGIGTQKAKALATQLGGQFRRQSNSPHGVICQLSWPL